MFRIGITLGMICFATLLALAPAPALGDDGGVVIGAGLAPVSSEDFNDKIGRMVGAVYSDAVKIAPLLTLIVFVGGGILGVFWREARISVAWSVAALILIMWAPQLIDLVIHYINQ